MTEKKATGSACTGCGIAWRKYPAEWKDSTRCIGDAVWYCAKFGCYVDFRTAMIKRSGDLIWDDPAGAPRYIDAPDTRLSIEVEDVEIMVNTLNSFADPN